MSLIGLSRKLRLYSHGVLACLILTATLAAQDQADVAAESFFASKVWPLLQAHCFECHSHAAGEANGQLMLDTLEAMLAGGSRGPSIERGHSDTSLLFRALRYDDVDLQMPPDGKLPESVIEIFRVWIDDGAHVPKEMRGDSPPERAGGAANAEKALGHWAYQMPKAWQGSGDGQTSAIHFATPIDQILLVKLANAQLGFSPRADRRTLIRRLHYDLTGLPPSWQDVERFLGDSRPDRIAYESVADRLLTSPQFGERWARYWMDVARYADNKGYVFQEDREYAEAYRYRDWLIRSLNGDLPYDQFVTQQLAADLLPSGNSDHLPALGFLTLGRRFLNNPLDIIDDRLDVMSRGLMGMTLSCARCHDHKYDPITQADYYSLLGVFLNTEEPGGEPWPHRLADTKNRRDSFILIRGNSRSPGAKVERRFVSFLAPGEESFPAEASGRVELAEHIVAPENPLTARVIANRVWMRLTGASLVESPSDFGIRCPAPAQLELLDHLAVELVGSGWSLKSLIRQIVTSEFYAQDSFARPEGMAIDPINELYWRMNRRRLDFESLRDTLLRAAGNWDFRVYGQSQKIEVKPFPNRRTIYSYIDRQNLPSLFRTFDMASPDTHSPKRAETSVPQQGLYLLNSDFVLEQSRYLGEQARNRADEQGRREAVIWLFQTVLAREPLDREIDWFDAYLTEQLPRPEPLAAQRWVCGFAKFDAPAARISDFQTLPRLVKGSWQGGEQLPDPVTGWCSLNAAGGHPGDDLQHAVVRRWLAPRTGTIEIRGKLSHDSEKGDGVRSTLLVAGQSVGQWRIQMGSTRTTHRGQKISAGQYVDFVTDCLATPDHDTFEWPVTIEYLDEDSRGSETSKYESINELPEAVEMSLGAWGQVVQALLLSNELAFVD